MAYFAPERLKSLKSAEVEKTNVWILGIILYQLLRGDLPRTGSFAAMRKWEYGGFEDMSEDVNDLLQKMLTNDPKERITVAGILKHKWMKMFELEYNLSIRDLIREQDKQEIHVRGDEKKIKESQDAEAEKEL